MSATGRRKGVFQKVDPWMQYDPDIMEAGATAEFIHRRGLDLVRRNLTDGTIRKVSLPELAEGIPHPARHVNALVAVGIWIDEGDTWRIRNWEKWNLTAAERESRAEERAAQGKRGMHARWHDEERPSSTCNICQELGWRTD